MLFYTQCCDVNQPLHPPVRAIPTLGEASGSSPGHRNLLPSFPGSRLGQGGAGHREQPRWGCPVAAPSSALPAAQPRSFRILHTALQIQPQEIFPCGTSHPRETFQAFSPQNLLLPIPPGQSFAGLPRLSPNSCLYKVPVSLPRLERFIVRMDTHLPLQWNFTIWKVKFKGDEFYLTSQPKSLKYNSELFQGILLMRSMFSKVKIERPTLGNQVCPSFSSQNVQPTHYPTVLVYEN